MNTFLGASSRLTTNDISEELVARAKILYCEGYLWDLDEAKQAIRLAMDIAEDNGVTSSLTLSDAFCIDRHREEWLSLIADRVTLLFGNNDELVSMLGTENPDELIAGVRDLTETACITQGGMLPEFEAS